MSLDELLTAENLAKRWRKSSKYLAELRCKGDGPEYVKIGRQVLYRPEDIREYEAKNLRRHTSQDFLKQY